MTSSGEGLAAIQDWLRLVVTAPGGVREGIRLAVERHGEALPVRVPAGVHPGERLAIHARGYLDRLLSCLRADHPAVRALVGDALFDAFAMGYLRACPPRHPSLFVLGEGFADHLDATCPEAGRADPLVRLPIDLARAERARLQAIRAPGIEGAARGGGGLDLLLGEEVRVTVTPCLRRVDLSHDVRAFLAAVDRGEAPVTPEARPVHLAVSRVDYRIAWTELVPWQQRALDGCRGPRALPALAEEIAAASGEDRGAALADLIVWLPVAEGRGLVSVSRGQGPS